MIIITVEDLQLFDSAITQDQGQEMINDAVALAVIVAPCLDSATLDPGKVAAAKAILRAAILRRAQALRDGNGAVDQSTYQAPGGWQIGRTLDTTSGPRRLFYPSEITDLQALCTAAKSGPKFKFPPACPAVPEREWARK